MNFKMGKMYIADVTEKGIRPVMEFNRSEWYNKDYDDLDFLTDEEKAVVINNVLNKIKSEILCNIVEDDENSPARLRADRDAANKAHMIDIAIIEKNLINFANDLAPIMDKTESKKNVSEIWKKCCPSKETVREWRKLHPLGRKIQCHRDTQLSRPTIDRYWDLVLQEE